MNWNKILVVVMLAAYCGAADAQEWKSWEAWNVGVTAGSTGIGAEVSMPVTRNVQMRVGGTYMPRFEKTMNFGVEVGKDKDYRTDEQNAATKKYYMENIQSFMRNFISYDMNDNIDMVGRSRFGNAKVLVDWMPFKDKRWHVTAGVYIGGRTIATAKNRMEDMATLMGVNMYNDLYKKGAARAPMFEVEGVSVEIPDHFVSAMLVYYGEMAIKLGEFSHDIIATEDVYWDYDYYEYGTNELVHAKGDLRCAKGEVLYHEGEAYRMTPTEDNMVEAKMKVNPIRPYVGGGFSGRLMKGSNINIGVEAGVMMWGGCPSVVTHDGIDMVKDLRNVRGKVGDYVKLIKEIKALPVVEVKVNIPLYNNE